MCRPVLASSPTAIPTPNSKNASTRPRRCFAPPRKPAASPAPPNAGSKRTEPTWRARMRAMTRLQRIDRLIATLIAAAQWLALPLIVLLFLQWPLRDLVRGYSREANDLGQVIFAVYVALSISAATRAGTHLAADTLAQRYSPRTRRRLKQFGATIAILPWALFILYAGKTIVMSSLLGLEAFPDTNNHGYFIIKAALWIMAVMIVAQALVDLLRPVQS